MPATVKKTTKTTKKQLRAPYAPKVKTVSEDGVTVNIGHTAETADTVTVLFRSRISQTFRLRGGKSVTLNGNAVYLANARGGVLPAGGYGVTVVDRALWEQVKREKMQSHGAWFRSGKIKEQKTEAKGVNYALDHADEKAGNDPIDPTQTETEQEE